MIARERHLNSKLTRRETPAANRESQESSAEADRIERSASVNPFAPIVRERVIALFRKNAEYRVTLVEAPAGFGKSVAVRQYLEQDGEPHLRLALRREHETLIGFLTGFASALADVAPEATNLVYSAYEAANSSAHSVVELASWLTGLMTAFHGTIAIDDLHLTNHDPRVSDLIRELIERTPRNKWILVTRDASLVPTATWIGYGLLGTTIGASDLAVSFVEASLIAARSGVALSAEELSQLLGLTQAWPVAFAFSINGASRTNDLRLLASGTREMVYAFLADQVLRRLGQEERDFLFATALLPTLDFELLQSAGVPDPAAAVERVRRSTAFVFAERGGAYRYHDLFRAFLDEQLRRMGMESYSAKCRLAGGLLAKLGNFGDALELYSRGCLTNDVVALLEQIGLELADSGRLELVERTLRWLERFDEWKTPKIIALLAYLKRSRGEYAEADRLFKHAADSAVDPELRVELSLRYTDFLIYPGQRYSDALALLDGISAYPTSNQFLNARLAAARAFLLSSLGRGDEASVLTDTALSLVCTLDPSCSTSLRIALSAAHVALHCEHFERACALAREIAERAEAANLPRFAHAALCIVALGTYDRGKIVECISAISHVGELAELTGSKEPRHYYLAVSYDLAMSRGDAQAVCDLENQLQQESKHDLDSVASLGTVYSLRAARAGDFQEAYDVALRSQFSNIAGHKLLNLAKLLLYSAAAGMSDKATTHFASFNSELSKRPKALKDSFSVSQSRAFAALAALLIERPGVCENQLSRLENFGSRRYSEVGYLVTVIRAMKLHKESGTGGADTASAIRDLRASALGGYADVMEHIAFGSRDLGILAVLTETELKVLRLLDGGATSRQIAAQTARSAHTIDTHVKAIARKFNCKGRREAISIARSRGIL